MEPSKMTPDQAKAKLDAGGPVTFLDDRSAAAWDSSDVKIQGALRVPAGEADQLLAKLSAVPRNATIISYCT